VKILLTFTGVHDPFAKISIAGEKETGPVLTVTSAQQFDCVHLFSTPGTAEISTQTKEELQQRNKSLTVEICDVPLNDAGNHLEISKQLKSHFKKIRKQNPNAEYYICVSSDIPHVDASWLRLAASGEIPARILQIRTTKFVRAGAGRVTEIDFTNPQFPQIRPFGALPDKDEPYDFQSLCDELCIVGDHALFLRELKTAFSMAEYDSPILLLGETNTGKEAFARLIHCASKRAAKPFITVNCAAFPETLIESRLFGHRKGAFPGADRDHKGCFEEADGGTLFLDELDGLPAQCQAKLLRAMEHGKIQRLDDNQESSVNARVIAATNVDIKDVIEEKKPRKDLYQSFYLLRFSPKTKKNGTECCERNHQPYWKNHQPKPVLCPVQAPLSTEIKLFPFAIFQPLKCLPATSYYCPRFPGLKVLQHQETRHAASDRTADQLHIRLEPHRKHAPGLLPEQLVAVSQTLRVGCRGATPQANLPAVSNNDGLQGAEAVIAPKRRRAIALHPRTIGQGENCPYDEHAIRRVKRARCRVWPDGTFIPARLAGRALLAQSEFPNWKLVEVVQRKLVNLLSDARALAPAAGRFQAGGDTRRFHGRFDFRLDFGLRKAMGGLVAEWQILFDTINVGWSDEHCFAQRPAAFGTFALKQMAPARAPAQHFASTGYLETFGH
jgi:hypothetical protein